jgi:hypothetical protein
MKKIMGVVIVLFLVWNIFAFAVSNSMSCQSLLLNGKLNTDILKSMKRTGNYDINGDGIDEKVVINSYEVRADLSLYNSETNALINYVNYEPTLFSGSLKVFAYQNSYYIVYYYDGKYLEPIYMTSIDSKNIENAICKFKNTKVLKLQQESTQYPKKRCDALLQKFKQDKTVTFAIPSKLIFNASYHYPFNTGSTTIGNIAYFDFNNDGIKEYVQLFEGMYDNHLSYALLKDDLQTPIEFNTPDVQTNLWMIDKNTTYYMYENLDHRSESLSIKMIDKNITKTVCEYHYDILIHMDNNITENL